MIKGFYLVSDDNYDSSELMFSNKLLKDVELEIINFEDIVPIASDENKLLVNDEKVDCPDFVFVRAFNLGNRKHHLRAILDMFERMGVICINPNLSRQITTDKLLSLQKSKEIVPEINIPKTLLVTPNLSLDTIENEIGFPLVIKINRGSEGRGVSLIKTKEELKNLLNVVFAAPFYDQILAQEAIISSKGKDLRIVIIGGEFFYSFVRSNESSFTSNIHGGGECLDYNPPQELINQSIKILDSLNIKYGSVDYLFGENEDEFYLCELNSMPGLPFNELMKEENKELINKFRDSLFKIISK